MRLWRSAGREEEERRDFHSLLSWGAEDEVGSRESVRLEEVREMSLSGEGDGMERS